MSGLQVYSRVYSEFSDAFNPNVLLYIRLGLIQKIPKINVTRDGYFEITTAVCPDILLLVVTKS